MKYILTTLLAALTLSTTSFAGTDKQFSVEGEITKFTQDNVTLLVRGKNVVVPRGSIPTYYSVKTGYRVVAYVPKETVLPGKKKK